MDMEGKLPDELLNGVAGGTGTQGTEYRYRINPNNCMANDNCDVCRSVCHANAIHDIPGGLYIDKNSCSGCGRCFEFCPHQAIIEEEA